MNEVRLEGKVERCFTGTSQKGNTWALFTVKVEGDINRNGEMTYQYINCKAFGDVAKQLAEANTEAKPTVKVLGTLKNEAKKDKNEFVMDTRGYKVYETSVSVKACEILSAINKTTNTNNTTTIPF